jgi:hypothetical protein
MGTAAGPSPATSPRSVNDTSGTGPPADARIDIGTTCRIAGMTTSGRTTTIRAPCPVGVKVAISA